MSSNIIQFPKEKKDKKEKGILRSQLQFYPDSKLDFQELFFGLKNTFTENFEFAFQVEDDNYTGFISSGNIIRKDGIEFRVDVIYSGWIYCYNYRDVNIRSTSKIDGEYVGYKLHHNLLELSKKGKILHKIISPLLSTREAKIENLENYLLERDYR